ncbi:MAG: hypothetical protein ACREOW_04350 [Thermodesulfobacteriota bacterium]
MSQELVFKNRDKVIKKLSLKQLEKITPSTTITVFEPNESENLRYNGFPVNTLLTAVYRDKWKEAEEILFSCSDGYQPSIPSTQFKEHSSYLHILALTKRNLPLLTSYKIMTS